MSEQDRTERLADLQDGEEIIGASVMHEDRREVRGEFVGKFGGGLMVEDALGNRHVIEAGSARRANPTLVQSLREAADVLAKHPGIAAWIQTVQLGRHLTGDDAARIDDFADAFTAVVEHRIHGPKSSEPGSRWTSVTTRIGRVELKFQAMTVDYEKATGKKVDHGGAR